MTPKKDYVIFDFDGTIVDSFDLFKNTVLSLKNEYFEGTPDFDLIKNAKNKSFIKGLKLRPTKAMFLLPHLKKELSEKIFSCDLFAGVEEMLSTLFGEYNLGIVSCNSNKCISSFLKSKNIEKYFDFIEGNSFLLDKRSSIRRALYNQGVYFNGSRAIYIGDEVKDITSSKKLGLPCMAVTYGYNNKETLAKHNPTYISNSAKGIVEQFLMFNTDEALEPSKNYLN